LDNPRISKSVEQHTVQLHASWMFLRDRELQVSQFCACSGHATLPGLKVCLVSLTHETKYASGTMKFVDLLAPQDPSSYRPGHQWCSQRGGGSNPPFTSKPFFTAVKLLLLNIITSLTTRKTINSHDLRKTNHWGGGCGSLLSTNRHNTLVTFGKAHLCCRWLNRYILTSL